MEILLTVLICTNHTAQKKSMPIPFYHHLGGRRTIHCGDCLLYLSNEAEKVSNRFTGATGKAYLYARVWNIKVSEPQDREMLTGKHIVRDVMCKNCDKKLGWMYEFAMVEDQRYKEGKNAVIRNPQQHIRYFDPISIRPNIAFTLALQEYAQVILEKLLIKVSDHHPEIHGTSSSTDDRDQLTLSLANEVQTQPETMRSVRDMIIRGR